MTTATPVLPAAATPRATPLVIAHRGASGYLPEHTLEAKALAYAQGADYLEQDVIFTRDAVAIVMHDLVLDETTDVREVFPGRARADGHWYVIDFEWAELQRLTVHERRAPGAAAPARSGRYPGQAAGKGVRFRLHTLDEELEFIAGLNATLGARTGHVAGVYTEVKSPAFHRAAGIDASLLVLAALARHGYTRRSDRAFVQCFDFAELKRIRQELHSDLPLVQLVGENAWGESDTDYDHLRTAAGLREVAAVADGVGPWIPQVLQLAPGQPPKPTGLVEAAHALGLVVHPYTLRADELPPGVPDFTALVAALRAAGIDGAFSDFPDLLRDALR